MPGKEHAQAGAARGLQHARDPRRHHFGSLELADDADLHVIDHQRQLRRIADILERLRHRDAKCVFHGHPFRCAASAE
jgi:hypothetical protein